MPFHGRKWYIGQKIPFSSVCNSQIFLPNKKDRKSPVSMQPDESISTGRFSPVRFPSVLWFQSPGALQLPYIRRTLMGVNERELAILSAQALPHQTPLLAVQRQELLKV
jgi:hypothetical protein